MITTKASSKGATPNARKKIKQQQKQSLDPVLSSYYLSLVDPFHVGALGAKVPDQYSCPTVTQTIRGSFTVTADASGNALLLALPNPLVALAMQTGSCGDFSTITYGDATTRTNGYWGIDKSGFPSKLDNYRVVGYGIRVTGLSSMTNSSGKFIFGTYPITTSWSTKDFTVGGATPATNASLTAAQFWKELGVPYNGSTAVPSALVNMPGSRVYSAVEASENIIELCPRLSTPAAMNFRETADSFLGFDYVSGSTSAGDASYLKIDGYEACYVYYTGGTASTSSFDVEIVYHLEGKPSLNTGATQAVLAIQPSASHTVSPVKPIGMLKCLEAAAREPVVKTVIEQAANFIHPMLGRLAGAALRLF